MSSNAAPDNGMQRTRHHGSSIRTCVGEPLKLSVWCSTDMNRFFRVALISILGLFAGEEVFAREWRGIVPLRSNRADVVRATNQCSDQRRACLFTLERE